VGDERRAGVCGANAAAGSVEGDCISPGPINDRSFLLGSAQDVRQPRDRRCDASSRGYHR
ncbi:MAG TPA: hypothetical protein VED63_03870, partial [Acidimicrobiales bacterium]|nr:hypothetical protein [Acidimicrobiales bacterium]